MIERRTVLVLGAGASAAYSFPLGRDLLHHIVKNLRGRGTTLEALKARGFNTKAIGPLADDIERSYQPSIDRFLAIRADDELTAIGKTAIACALIPYESPGALEQGGGPMRWYEYLFQELDFDSQAVHSPLSVVTFNYDRSLEHFLATAIKHSLGVSNAAAESILNTLPIVHPYGQLGKFTLSQAGENMRRFDPKIDNIDAAIDSLRIMYEGQTESSEITAARGLIRDAEIICFLGCGYHRENIDRLGLKHYVGKQILGSTYWLGKDEVRRAARVIAEAAGAEPHISADFGEGYMKPQIVLGDPLDDCLSHLKNARVFD